MLDNMDMNQIINLVWIVLLILLVVAFIWVGIELAVTLRKTRKTLSNLSETIDGAVTNINATVQKVDQLVEDANPAIQHIEPLLGKAETTVDALSLDLLYVNDILGDVKQVSDAAQGASAAVSGVVDRATGAMAGVVNKLSGSNKKESLGKKMIGKATSSAAEKLIASATEQEIPAQESVKKVAKDAGYFTYPETAQVENSPESALANESKTVNESETVNEPEPIAEPVKEAPAEEAEPKKESAWTAPAKEAEDEPKVVVSDPNPTITVEPAVETHEVKEAPESVDIDEPAEDDSKSAAKSDYDNVDHIKLDD